MCAFAQPQAGVQSARALGHNRQPQPAAGFVVGENPVKPFEYPLALADGLARVRVADGPGDNHIALPLVTSMFLGDRWEYLFHPGHTRLRAYGTQSLGPGEHWLALPAEDVWVFPSA